MLKEQSDLTQQWSYTVMSHSLRPAVAMVTHWHALRNHGSHWYNSAAAYGLLSLKELETKTITMVDKNATNYGVKT